VEKEEDSGSVPKKKMAREAPRKMMIRDEGRYNGRKNYPD